MIVAGFDVGINGGAAALTVGEMGTALLDCIALPTLADGSNRQIDVRRLGLWLESVSPDIAYVENVTPMPSKGEERRSMGATSAFRFGMACGAIRATLVSYSIPLVLVTPQSWKRHFGLRGSNKEDSRGLAVKLVPESSRLLSKKKDHNLAEALLLAVYGSSRSANPG